MDNRLEVVSTRALARISDRYYEEDQHHPKSTALVGWSERKPLLKPEKSLRLNLYKLTSAPTCATERSIEKCSPVRARAATARPVGHNSPCTHSQSTKLRPDYQCKKAKLFVAVPDAQAASPGPLLFLPFRNRTHRDSLYTEMEEIVLARRKPPVPSRLHCLQRSLALTARSQSSRPGTVSLSGKSHSLRRITNLNAELRVGKIDLSRPQKDET